MDQAPSVYGWIVRRQEQGDIVPYYDTAEDPRLYIFTNIHVCMDVCIYIYIIYNMIWHSYAKSYVLPPYKIYLLGPTHGKAPFQNLGSASAAKASNLNEALLSYAKPTAILRQPYAKV